jgi:hypothetical protein
MSRKALWLFFFLGLVFTLGAKAVWGGWLGMDDTLNLNGKPTLVFFTLSLGCECQMTVVSAAETQLANWESPLPLLRVDFDRQRKLAAQWKVARAPALVLVNAEGQAVWKQDEGLSDESPLDLNQAERQIEALAKNP